GRARGALDRLWLQITETGVPDADRRYNLTWMDRLNLENLVLVSRAICAAAEARADSRGAHFREDYPKPSELAASRYTVARYRDGRFSVDMEPVMFTRVRPGETLLPAAATAAQLNAQGLAP
ncbi:MAG TPA: succinate dehydrogenase/fumarate reductase flavoprotein subunit, partial [Xanthobacteraceae bacterium]